MFARVMQMRILPGKLNDYLMAVESLRPGLRKQAGFRAMLLLRSADTPAKEGNEREIIITTYTVWETMEHMRASEKNLFLYQAVARMQEHCKGFPQIHEEEVIASELGGGNKDDTQA
jgi:heme-degrading monooxygenase HmoA